MNDRTIQQKMLHTIGLDSASAHDRLYTLQGKKYYKADRNYYSGKDSDLDELVCAGYMNYIEAEIHGELYREYSFTHIGLEWLGEQLGITIQEEDLNNQLVKSCNSKSVFF